MKKRLLAIALFFASLSMAACGGNDVVDPNALTLMGKKSDLEKTYMTRIFDLYRKETGENLNIVSIEDSEYESYALERFRGGDVPDLFLHFHNADLGQFDVAENFLYLNDRPWASDLTESAYAYCRDADGNLLGLPFWESSVSGCYYNKTLLEECGLGPVAKQADFDALCDTLSALGQTPICWPANKCSWLTQFGLDPVFADDPELLAKLNANEISYSEIPAVKDMIGWISDAAKKGWFGKDYLEIGWDNISDQLNSGEAAMTFIWDTWFYTDFKPGKYTIDDFALMPIFMNTSDEGTYEGGNLNMMMVNKNSAKLDKALAFLDFCATPKNYNIAFERISTVSCFKQLTTNIQSKMVTDAQRSIAKYERVSTAETKIIGYSSNDIADFLCELFKGRLTVDGCIAKMDEDRIARAHSQGVPGF